MKMGKLLAVCISEKKGTVKKNIGTCRIIEDFGLENDAHAGSGRQVSLLSADQVEAFRERSKGVVELPPGIFGENLLVEGFDFKSFPVGTCFQIGEVLLELTQIGKKCHSGCEIMQRTGECIMPKEGVFARVITGGTVSVGDEVLCVPKEMTEKSGESFDQKNNDSAVENSPTGQKKNDSTEENPAAGSESNISTNRLSAPFRAAILTASDRSFRGEREDKSGPKIAEILTAYGYQIGSQLLLPDDEDGLAEALKCLSDEEQPDVIFTTGGTGFSPRDRMPEATKRVGERDVPGIAEGIRAYSLTITPRAMLSRAASVIRGKTLIVNLPGSPKAVTECLEYLLPVLEHGLLILRGEADG